MAKSKKVLFFVDGASRGNPGPAGIGVVIYDNNGNCIGKISKYIGETTNNVAEYTALNFALAEGLILKFDQIHIKSDSELLVKQLNGQYKVKSGNIKNLFVQAEHLIRGFKKVNIEHIKREKNKEADKLAGSSIREKNK